MTIPPKIFVIAGILTTAAAQIFLKKAGIFEVFKLKWTVYMLLSLSFYALSFGTYSVALRHFEISTVSPLIMSSTVALIVLYGFFTGEAFNPMKTLGILLALVSILLITRG